MTSLSISSGGEIIFAAISIDINPDTHMIKVAGFLSRYLIKRLLLGQISCLSCNDKNITVGLTRWKESIRDDYSVNALPEYFLRNHTHTVGPLELI